jgi:tetratricopeptide (TPR) repeat protein
LKLKVEKALFDLTACRKVGDQYSLSGQHAKAIECYRQVIEHYPKDKEAFFAIADNLTALNCWDESLEYYQKAIKCDPTFYRAIGYLGVAFHELAHFSKAIDCYNRALALRPNNADLLFNKGLVLYELDRFAESLDCYDKIIENNKKDAHTFLKPKEISFSRGLTLAGLQRFNEAIESYDQSMKLEPEDPSAFSHKGLALYELKRFDEAIVCYDQALAIDPQDSDVLLDKAIALDKLADYPEEKKCYKKIIALGSAPPNVFYNFGVVLNHLGQHTKAIQSYDKAIALGLNDASVFHNKGLSESLLGHSEPAILCYNKAIALDPKFSAAAHDKGRLLIRLGRYQEAMQCYDEGGITSFHLGEDVTCDPAKEEKIMGLLSGTKLTSLHFSFGYCRHTLDELAELLLALPKNITTLRLQGKFFSWLERQITHFAHFGEWLVDTLKDNHTLTSIDLSGNRLSVDAIEAVETYARENLEAQLKATFCEVDEETGEEKSWAWFRFEAYLHSLSEDCQQFKLARNFLFARLSFLIKSYGFLLYRNLTDSMPDDAVRLYHLLLEVGSKHNHIQTSKKKDDPTTTSVQFERIEKSEALLKERQSNMYTAAIFALAAQELHQIFEQQSILVDSKKVIKNLGLKAQLMTLLFRVKKKGWPELRLLFLAMKDIPDPKKDALIKGITMLFKTADQKSSFHTMLDLLLEDEKEKKIKKHLRREIKKSEANYLSNYCDDKALADEDKEKVNQFLAVVFNSSAIEAIYLLSKPPELPKKFLPYLPNKILNISVLSELVEFSADKQEGDFSRFFGSSSQEEQPSEQLLLTA